MKPGGFVKSPYAAFRFIPRRCGVRTSTPHSSGFARLASGAFYKTAFFMMAPMLMIMRKKGRPTLTTFVKPASCQAILLRYTVRIRYAFVVLFCVFRICRNSSKVFILRKPRVGGQQSSEFKNIVFLPGTVTHYTDTDFVAGRAYFYKILVYSVRNIISDQSPVVKVIPASLPPPPRDCLMR